MALLNKTREDARSSEEEELEKLESDVMEMAHRILDYRAALPDQLRTTLVSGLAFQRPIFPHGLEPSPSGRPILEGPVESSVEAVQAEEDQETAEKIRLLKDKISSNVSATPVVLKRMKDCISKIDKLDSYKEITHPAFKRKKIS
ncbi:hypothetical protein I3843_02G023900 [Carya illinoinensis]|uniref:Uncharacterized protein n=2 Tax=Carya illinoinensis TaxID=32201 RepID=A0A922FRM3_CARIL|nr:uncharacterized protein LOC122298736 [Carya illinoinensis]KAG6725388.1 hypothetical protein I3842_02G030400 [Carya illinoinensis]KAG7990404.1 hypothetical protein I3843_02G023900 [Carya illinoinensis]